MKISIIIPCLHDNPQTIQSLKNFPFEHEIIISKKFGLGYARNYGALNSNGEYLLFLDSNLEINPKLFQLMEVVFRVEHSYLMSFDGFSHGGKGEPITQVLFIKKSDFNKVKFSEKIIYSGEDRDFFIKAVYKGLIHFLFKPSFYYTHIDHEIRALKSSYNLINFTNEHSKLLVFHGAKVRLYKGFFRWFFPYVFKKSYIKLTLKNFLKKFFISQVRNILFLFNLFNGVEL